MPTIVSPPDLERRPRRSEEDDGGHGRRPPNGRDRKRTGGGGDNDNWDNRPSRPNGPGQRLITYRLGLFFALGAVFLFFTGLVSVFSVTQTTGRLDVYNHALNTWLPTAMPPVLWLNTTLLLLSSVTVEIARRHMFHSIDAMEEWFGLGKPTSRRALPWLLATLLLGSLFLAGQVLAWHQLRSRDSASKPVATAATPSTSSPAPTPSISSPASSAWSPPSSASSPSRASKTARSSSIAQPGTGTP